MSEKSDYYNIDSNPAADSVDEAKPGLGASGNIPPGYKQTEVGVIPEHWEVVNKQF